MPEFKGGCLCGKIRYSGNAQPVFSGICHCRNCQRTSGSAFAIVIGVPADKVSIQGELKTYADTGDSGKPIYRRFCPECGASVMDEASVMPGVLMITAGTLDDASWVKPEAQIYCDSTQPWVRLGGEMKQFPKAPEQ